ncbi:hypothetical protein F5884DRAFT_746173 [Xylogone sp. PMI_703]|nr:hypothetical protein F5884DRAFT_746173 [Xylogone sp. PMI_703]
MTPKLEPVFNLRGYLGKDDISNLGSIRSGPHRIIFPVTHGFIEGPNIRGTILPGGSDWQTIDHSTGLAYLDVRFQAKTDDGEYIYLHYPGILKADEALRKFVAGDAGKTTSYGDHHFWITPVIEASGQKYKWLEENIFVGQGRIVVDDQGQAVDYQVYKVVN